MSAVAVYSIISPGTYLVTLTFGTTSGDFSFSAKAAMTVVRTAISAVSAFKSFSGINFLATSVGTLPFLKPSTRTSLASFSIAFSPAVFKSFASKVTVSSTRESDSFFSFVFIVTPLKFNIYYNTVLIELVVRKCLTVNLASAPSLISGFKISLASKIFLISR